MNKHLLFLLSVSVFFSSCLTRIVTVESRPAVEEVYMPTPLPTTGVVNTYTTTITTPQRRTISTTQVTPLYQDLSLYLDLQAVVAAFAQSSNVQEFELLLNNASYMLSNLDLNRDGYVDYLRVLEILEGNNHVFLIQAVLAANMYQDVATLIADVMSYSTARVQIVGAPYIYGPNYYVQPVYISTPVIFAHLRSPHYQPWKSPWYWDHFPSCYHRPAPIYLSHYQAYVHTFMGNHRYCHEVTYPDRCYYPDYDRVSRPSQRNDYGQQHPENSFVVRNANLPANSSTSRSAATSSSRMTNAREISERQAATVTTTTSSRSASSRQTTTTATPTPRQTSSTTASSTTARQSSTTTATRTATTATRPAASTTTTSRTGSSSTTSTSVQRSPAVQGTVSSRVTNSGTATTTRSGSSVSRSAATTATPAASRSTSATSTRSASGGASTRR